MHFRMRKSRSWLTIGGCCFEQLVFFLLCVLLSFRHCIQNDLFIDCCIILNRLSDSFGKFFGGGWKSRSSKFSHEKYSFRHSRAFMFQQFSQSFSDSIPDLILMVSMWICGSSGLPHWSQWASVSDTKKTAEKGSANVRDCTRLYAARGPTIIQLSYQGDAFQHQFTPARHKGMVTGFN